MILISNHTPLCLLLTLTLLAGCGSSMQKAPEAYGPVPTEAQLRWQRMEINMFCHYGPNTYSGAEWGDGTEAEDLFAPRALDCRQWVAVAKEAGMKGLILTAKHHDGFCLWPTKQSQHTVTQSQWRDGQGDVLLELSRATAEAGIGMGLYVSPWDRNHPAYGTEGYNTVFPNMLKEVLTGYGRVFELWLDGACGEGPNGKRQHYDWTRYMHTIKELQPDCIVFSDVGPGCRWAGNEAGSAGETCWSRLTVDGATPSENKPTPELLNRGQQDGNQWIPAECDVSLRPGWFWHPDEHPKSVEELMDIYFNSVGRNGLLLLNVPPDTNGRICAEDSLRLVEFRRERDRIFAHDLAQGAHARARHLSGFKAKNVLDTAYHTYWAAKDTSATLTLSLDSITEFDIIVIQEYIPLGQRIEEVQMAIGDGDGLRPYPSDSQPLCTTVGYKRIVRLERPLRANELVFNFQALAPPVINRIALYNSQAR